jgi:hypothetical protein
MLKLRKSNSYRVFLSHYNMKCNFFSNSLMKGLKSIYIIIMLGISLSGYTFQKENPLPENCTGNCIKEFSAAIKITFLKKAGEFNLCKLLNTDGIKSKFNKGMSRKAIPEDSYMLAHFYNFELLSFLSSYYTRLCEHTVKICTSHNNFLHLYQLF